MERLIATRPVLYQGRMYERGDALPAHDAGMVAAWLRAGSAKMAERIEKPAAPENNPPAAPENNPPAAPENNPPAAPENNPPAAPENNPPAAPESDPPAIEMVEGHLDPKQLEKMTKANLEKLAEDMGVDISGAKNNAERAALIAAVPVQAPVNDNGGAQ